MRTIELMLRHGKMTLANAFQRKGAIRKEEYVLSVADIVTSLHAHKQILAEGRSAIDRTNRQLAGETAALFPGFSIVSDAQVNFVRPGFLAPSMDESGIGFHRHEGFGGKLAAWKFAVTEETLAQSHGVPAQFPAHSPRATKKAQLLQFAPARARGLKRDEDCGASCKRKFAPARARGLKPDTRSYTRRAPSVRARAGAWIETIYSNSALRSSSVRARAGACD